MSDCAFDDDVNAFGVDHFERAAMTPPREPRTTLDNLWRELEMDALASDGPVADRDVKDAIARYRPRIEAESAGAPLREALERELAEALPWVIVPISDPEDPLNLLDWSEEHHGKMANWQKVAHRLVERLNAQGAFAAATPAPAPLDVVIGWLREPDTVQLFANALASWPPTAKPNEYVAAWRRSLATLLLDEAAARLTARAAAQATPSQATDWVWTDD